MDFYEAVRRRRMVRSYRELPVDAAAVDRIVDAARRGPSAGFAQGVEFVVITDAARRQLIAAAADEAAYAERGLAPWLSVAPVHVVVAVDIGRYRSRYAEADKHGTDSWTVPYWWVDAGAALMVLLLAAVAEGLAAGFLGSHAIAGLGEIAGLPDDYDTMGVVTIGHGTPGPVVGSATRGRRERTETVHYETWAPSEIK